MVMVNGTGVESDNGDVGGYDDSDGGGGGGGGSVDGIF